MKVFDLSGEFYRNALAQAVKTATERGDIVRFERVPKPRSTNQNRYYWAMMAIISDYTGFTVEESHIICKRYAKLFYTKNGNKQHVFLKSTADLDTVEMTEYITKVRDLGDSMGCYLPSSEEFLTNWKEIATQYS